MKRFLIFLLLCSSLNTFGQAPYQRNSATTNNPAKIYVTFSGPGVGGQVLSPVFADSTNVLWQLDGSFTDVHLHLTNLPGSSASAPINNFYATNIFATNITVLNNLYASNFFSTNVVIQNNLTVSNITVTNVTIQNNLTTSNLFYVSGKGNSLVVTQTLQVSGQYVYPLAAGTGITLTTNNIGTGQTNVTIAASSSGTTVSLNATNVTTPNFQDTATVTWAKSGSNITATASGGDTTATNIVTLTMTGTNVSSMDYSLVSRGGAFKLVLTGNAYIGAPANVANTTLTKAWLMVQQPSTGTCVLTFTNGFYAFPYGQTPVIDTNGGAVAVFEFVSDVFTNGLVHGNLVPMSKLIP
jgi:hypothetical protein